MSYVFCFNAQQDPHVPHELTNYYVVNAIELALCASFMSSSAVSECPTLESCDVDDRSRLLAHAGSSEEVWLGTGSTIDPC